MQYEYIEEKVMLSKCGNLDAFSQLIMEGCGSLYLYAAMLKNTKTERIRLVRNTYLSAWGNISCLEVPDKFDLWLKGILWKQAAIETDGEEEEMRVLAEEGVNTLIKEAFKSAENYWYLPLQEKERLAYSVIEDIRSREQERIH